MNDFVIQVYENFDVVKLQSFHGLNNSADYLDYINYNEKAFRFRVFSDAKRKEFLRTLITNEKVQKTIQYYGDMFDQFWQRLFGVNSPIYQKEHYIQSLINGDANNLLKYSKEEVFKFSLDYMTKLFNVKK